MYYGVGFISQREQHSPRPCGRKENSKFKGMKGGLCVCSSDCEGMGGLMLKMEARAGLLIIMAS